MAEDRAVAGRYLLRHQSKPGPEVAAFREYISSADRSHHCARDKRANARHRHQSLAGLILTGQRFDLATKPLNTRIEPAPAARQILDDAKHARQEHIGASREDTWQLGPQGMPAL